ncbi:MAG: sulfatase [Acidobacteria bacterium]|nr:sulfatase [Acidobacteriota bacterium]
MITRRQFAAGCAAAPAVFAQGGRRWNFLFVSCEDTSPDLGCYGDQYASTPNIDKLATEGLRYTHAFSTYGVCAPSRSSIITAMYPATIGTHHMRSQGVPPPEVKCFTEYLRAAGYYCTNNSKTDYNFAPPETAWDESSPRAHWRGRASNDQPFFAVFNFVVSHESQVRAPEETYRKNIARLKPEQIHDPAKAQLPPYYPDTPAVRKDWARLHDNISAMDAMVGDTLRELEADGLAGNTIVFFWGDHGRGLPRAKRWVYDSGTRVPLIIRWPGTLAAGTVTDRMVSLMDLGPTLLSLAGVAPPKHMQGQAFLGAHAGAPREYTFMARDRMDETYDLIRSVRDKRYRYIRNYQAGKPYAQYIEYMDQMPTLREMRRLNAAGQLTGAQKLFFRPEKPVEELFDSEADPHEVNDLARDPKYAGILARMRGVHERFMKETGDLGLIPEDELKEKMRPGGVFATAAVPTATVRGEMVTLACETPGASIAYTFEAGAKARWLLYSKPVRKTGPMRAKACRLGYKDSPEVKA